jgi:dienelactone hydrolase
MMYRFVFPLIALLPICSTLLAAEQPAVLPGTKPLTEQGDFSAKMVAGIHRYLDRATKESVAGRDQFWKRDFSSPAAYAKSVEPNRQRLKTLIGAVDQRLAVKSLEYIDETVSPALVCDTGSFRVLAVRWKVFADVYGEGLLLDPNGPPVARVVAIPDADQTPEMFVGLDEEPDACIPFARRLAEAGCQVVVPVLIDRNCTFSGNPEIAMTDQTHREWVYRQALEMGRNLIGYEVQKVLAAVDWFMLQNENGPSVPIGVAGYGEGGLLALYSAALDARIDAALVSGYFDARERLYEEPIYRNVFRLLREFGDAEIADLLAPRPLIVEHSLGPQGVFPVNVPPGRRKTAAPGQLVSPCFEYVQKEVDRAKALCTTKGRSIGKIELIAGTDGAAVGPASDESLQTLLMDLGVPHKRLPQSGAALKDAREEFDPEQRQKRQLTQLVEHSQRLLRRAERIRADFWKKADSTSIESWQKSTQQYRDYFWTEITGRLPDPTGPPNVRTRKLYDRPDWTGYEVMIDVWPDVFAWGYLLVPKGIRPGERRPVVVCQHGLEGLPESVVVDDPSVRASRVYAAFAVRLAERGFVTYAPHNPYRGETEFRQLQRKANPLGLTLYSFIIGQHERTLDWLSALPFVDPDRIGFYGLSYGGLSAVRIPSILDRYALSICSACFNDWTRKIMSLDFRAAYMFTREYDHFSFNLGSTFNHAELAGLIAPRPFMVERGHGDGVAPDEWVAYEYAKVRRLYAQLGFPENTEIEFFNGGHVINSQGTFDFLHRHLKWPKPGSCPGDFEGE